MPERILRPEVGGHRVGDNVDRYSLVGEDFHP